MKETKLSDIALGFIAIVLFVIMLKTFQNIFVPLTFAIMLTVMLLPFVKSCKKCGIPTFITLFGLFLIFGILSFFLVQITISAFSNMSDELPVYEENIKNQLTYLKDQFQMELHLENYISASSVVKVLDPLRTLFSSIIIVLLFTAFILPSHQEFMKRLSKMGKGNFVRFQKACVQIEQNIRSYLYVKSMVSLGTAFVSAIVMYFFNIDFVVIFALFIFILNFIPNIGSIIATAFPIITYFLKFGFELNLLWLALSLVAIQFIFGNIIEPKWAGDKLQLSPVVILISLMFWYWVWGIPGMLLSTPLASILKIILEHNKNTEAIAKLME